MSDLRMFMSKPVLQILMGRGLLPGGAVVSPASKFHVMQTEARSGVKIRHPDDYVLVGVTEAQQRRVTKFLQKLGAKKVA
jgi:hypothetical protein